MSATNKMAGAKADGGAVQGYSILRLPLVMARTGLSRSSVYLRIAQGEFPKPISLGARAVGWIDAEIEQWLRVRIAASRATNGKRDGIA